MVIGAGSDAGSCYTPHPSVIEELKTMNNYVDNNRAILKTATSNAGNILGLNVGQITVGYQADFILLKDNPLKNLSALNSISEVYLNGELID